MRGTRVENDPPARRTYLVCKRTAEGAACADHADATPREGPRTESGELADLTKQLIISRSPVETRIGLLEDGALAELQVETRAEPSSAGNIYNGRVVRVLPGMQAAFVEIGQDKAAFLHVSDFWDGGEEPDDEDPGETDDPADAEAGDPSASAEPLPENGEAEEEEEEERQDDSSQGSAEDASASGEPESAEEPEEGPLEESDDSPDEPEDEAGETRAGSRSPGHRNRRRRAQPEPPPIEELLKQGQEVLVQVSKEPMGTKGARVTAQISLPGRYIVYMPTSSHIGVSRRIENARERQRLRKIVAANRPESGGGYIVRTACEGLTSSEIAGDIEYLTRLWTSIQRKAETSTTPALVHEDLDLVLRSVRDMVTPEVEEILVDGAADFDRVTEFSANALDGDTAAKVKLYDGVEPVFDHLGVANQARRALERRVWLKSGGYLVIEQTEALTTIDVNTGRFVGKNTHEDTVVRTNLEAARACIDQLRLRNVGGIIVIDLIDMEKAENRSKVSEALEEAVKRDKARTNILKISELGLVQMTRKRTRENLRQLITTPCAHCDGEGRVLSKEALAAEALRAAQRKAALLDKPQPLVIKAPSEIAGFLRQALEAHPTEGLSARGFALTVRGEPGFERDQIEVEVGAAPKRRRRGGRRRRKARAKETEGATQEPAAVEAPAAKAEGD